MATAVQRLRCRLWSAAAMRHATNTDCVADTAVGDSKYRTNENLIVCYDRGVRLHKRPL